MLLLALAALLGSCDRADVNARKQSGVWAIRRVTTTTRDTLGTVLNTQTVTDAGEVAFINITGQAGSTDDEARFYLDKPVNSKVLSYLRAGGGGSTTVCEWLNEDHDRRRIILRLVTDDPFAGLLPIVLTLADETDDTQRWLYVESQGDYIVYREEWEVQRSE